MNATITRKDLDIQLILSGVDPAHVSEESYQDMEAELDAINYSGEAWTQADLDRQALLTAALDKAGRL